MSLAAEMKISPVLLSTLTVLGSCAGGLSPLAATGIIGANLCAEFGLTGIENDFLMNGILSFTIYAVIIYICWEAISCVLLLWSRKRGSLLQ